MSRKGLAMVGGESIMGCAVGAVGLDEGCGDLAENTMEGAER